VICNGGILIPLELHPLHLGALNGPRARIVQAGGANVSLPGKRLGGFQHAAPLKKYRDTRAPEGVIADRAQQPDSGAAGGA
jgi:hypothetical protein